jgi:hypothetical protein
VPKRTADVGASFVKDIERPASSWVAPVFITLGAIQVGLASLSWTGAYEEKVWVLGAMLGCLVCFEWFRAGHPVTPVGLVGLGGLLIFFLRPLLLPGLGVTSPGAAINNRAFVGATTEAASVAATQVSFFVLALGVVYLHCVSGVRRTLVDHHLIGVSAERRQVRRAGILLLISLAVGVGCAVLLIDTSGGLDAHFAGVAHRSSFLAGRYYLTLGYLPLLVALVNYVTLRRRTVGLPTWSAFGIVSACALLAVAFVTGGRGPLILGALVPLLLLKQIGPRPMRAVVLWVTGLLLVAGAMVMSVVLRENVYTGGQAVSDLKDRPAISLVNRLTSGAETRPFDSVVLLNEVEADHKLERQWGTTYAKVPTWFLPSSVLASKDGGANTWFTKTYLPSFYYPARVETSISAIGESYANFGWAGIAVVGGLTGLAAARFGRLGQRHTSLADSQFVLLTPVFFSFVRGDAYQNLSLTALLLLLSFAANTLSTAPGAKSANCATASVTRSARNRAVDTFSPSSGAVA